MKKTLNIKGRNFQLFKEIMDETTWKTALQDKIGKETLELFSDIFCTTQELLIPTYKNQSWVGASECSCLSGQTETQEGNG